MPRYFHPNDGNNGVPVQPHPVLGYVIQPPKAFRTARGIPMLPAAPGAIVVNISATECFVCVPRNAEGHGGFVDIDHPPEVVKAFAPQLLTESEAIERGLSERPSWIAPSSAPSVDEAGRRIADLEAQLIAMQRQIAQQMAAQAAASGPIPIAGPASFPPDEPAASSAPPAKTNGKKTSG